MCLALLRVIVKKPNAQWEYIGSNSEPKNPKSVPSFELGLLRQTAVSLPFAPQLTTWSKFTLSGSVFAFKRNRLGASQATKFTKAKPRKNLKPSFFHLPGGQLRVVRHLLRHRGGEPGGSRQAPVDGQHRCQPGESAASWNVIRVKGTGLRV